MRSLTALELATIVRELQPLAGARVNKIYQPTTKKLLIKLYGGENNTLLIKSGIGAYLTNEKSKNPATPFSFCSALRKRLNGLRLASASQHELDRILILKFAAKETYLLICELFSKGNFVLTDKNYKIVLCAHPHKFKDRTIKIGEKYKFPKKEGIDLRKLTKTKFLKAIKNTEKKTIGAFLGANLGIGSPYSDEIFWQSDVAKNTAPFELNAKDATNLFSVTSKIISKFKKKFSSQLALDNNKTPLNFSAFPLESQEKYELKKFATFSEAADKYYTYFETENNETETKKLYKKELLRYESICEKQEKAIETYEKKQKLAIASAELIYKDYQKISNLIKKIKLAEKSGKKMGVIARIIKHEARDGHPEAKLIKKIYPADKLIVLNLNPEVSIDLTASLEQNASLFYDKAKKLKKKIAGANKAIAKAKKDLEHIKLPIEKIKAQPKPRAPAKWYEKFHWFYTSEGNLAIGGKDATSNEIVIKKHVEKDDLIFHTKSPGSPFFILKSLQKTKKEINEVATATAAYSRAWKSGMGAADVFWIHSDQISKAAPSGMYVSKGGFVVRGKKNELLNIILELAIGLNAKEKIEAGAPSAIQKNCAKAVIIKPGYSKPSDVAKQIIKKLGLNNSYLDEVMKGLPAGKSDIKK